MADQIAPNEAAEQFSGCLDRRNYDALRELLATDCVYEMRESLIRGPASIADAYRDATEWAFRCLDRIEFQSSVTPESEASARVTFVDRLFCGSGVHQHKCQQVVTIDQRGKIVRIEHFDIPGETDSLRAFFNEYGIQPPQTRI